jgi:hypothetical protein
MIIIITENKKKVNFDDIKFEEIWKVLEILVLKSEFH